MSKPNHIAHTIGLGDANSSCKPWCKYRPQEGKAHGHFLTTHWCFLMALGLGQGAKAWEKQKVQGRCGPQMCGMTGLELQCQLIAWSQEKTTGKGEEAGQRSLVSLLSESNGVNSITNCATRVPTPSQPWPGDTTPAHKNSGHKSGRLPPIDPLQFEMFSAGRSPHWQDQLYQ